MAFWVGWGLLEPAFFTLVAIYEKWGTFSTSLFSGAVGAEAGRKQLKW